MTSCTDTIFTHKVSKPLTQHAFPKVTTNITNNTNKAIEDLELDKPDVKVFIDGLEIERKIGAVAVLY